MSRNSNTRGGGGGSGSVALSADSVDSTHIDWPLLASAGSVSAPSYAVRDANVGIYSPQTGHISISAGAEMIRFGSSTCEFRKSSNPSSADATNMGSATKWFAGLFASYNDFNEQFSAPASPSAGHARLFVEDDGGGKTRLVIKFDDDADIVIATQT